MAKFDDLSIELVEAILKLVGDPLVLLKVCKDFNAIATPILYHSIHLHHQSPSPSLEDRLHHSLLLAIIAKPYLGKFVKRLSMDLKPVPKNQEESDAFHNDIFVTRSRTLDLSQAIQIALAGNTTEAILVLLLHYLPNLSVLEYALFKGDDLFFDEILSDNRLPLLLSKVIIVKAKHLLGRKPIAAFFRLPALNTFIVDHSIFLGHHLNHTLPRASNVEHIRLSNSIVEGLELTEIIHATPSLRTFVYESKSVYTALNFDASVVGDVLRKHVSSTLEYLRISLPSSISRGVLTPLCDFTRLTHLTAPFHSLLELSKYKPNTANSTIAYQFSMLLPISLISLTLVLGQNVDGIEVMVIEELVKIKFKRLVHWKELVLIGVTELGSFTIQEICVEKDVIYCSKSCYIFR